MSIRDDTPSTSHTESLRFQAASSPPTLAAYGVLLLISVYYLLQYLEHTYLPLSEILWNIFVYILPARMISFLDSEFQPVRAQRYGARTDRFDSIYHASKSNALRRAFGLSKSDMTTVVQRNRTLSDLGSVFKTKAPEKPPGLGNWDHSCYQNSVIQGLASIESLSRFLGSEKDNLDGPTAGALRQIIKTLNAEENMGKTFWTPTELKSMSSWQQQDAQEYFSKIMDALEKDSFRSHQRRRSFGLQYVSNKMQSRDREPYLERIYETNTNTKSGPLSYDQRLSFLRNPLDGLLAQRVGCQRCGYVEGLSLVPFNCLTVPLGRRESYHVLDCLDEYTALESINGVDCTNCTLQNAQLRTSQLLDRTLESSKVALDRSSNHPQVDELLANIEGRLKRITQALEDADYSDGVLKKCQIPSKSYVTTTKSRQAVIARAPQALAIHINRSIFDERTGAQSKNYASVQFPIRFDLRDWCLGAQPSDSQTPELEQWITNPLKSMLPESNANPDGDSSNGPLYELRAVVTHYGRHENGHYVCYRRSPYLYTKDHAEADRDSDSRSWWRLSDEDVSEVSEQFVLAQGGAFMLFYEQIHGDQKASSKCENIGPVHVAIPNDELVETSDRHLLAEEQHEPQVPAPDELSIRPSSNSNEIPDHGSTQSKDPTILKNQAEVNAVAPVAPNISPASQSTQPENSNDSTEKADNGVVPVAAPQSVTTSSPPESPSLESFHPSTPSTKEVSTSSVPVQPVQPRTGRDQMLRSGHAMESMAGFVQAN